MALDPPNWAFLRVGPPIFVANRSINAQGELPKGQPSPVMVLTPAPSWKIINFINRTPRGLISSCDLDVIIGSRYLTKTLVVQGVKARGMKKTFELKEEIIKNLLIVDLTKLVMQKNA